MTKVVHLAWGAHSEKGPRAENQDQVVTATPVFAVADGMGGHASGGAASAAAVALLGALSHQPRTSIADLRMAMRRADEEIRALVAGGDEAGAGTTVAGVGLVEHGGEPYWAVFALGDSRVYLWDGEVTTQLSVDHSVVQELLDAGTITPAAATSHPERNVITRALGVGPVCEADFSLLPVRIRQRFLACTDGVWGALASTELAAVLSAGGHPQQAAAELVGAALAAGSVDNASAIVVDVLAATGRTDAPVSDAADATIPRAPVAYDPGGAR